MSVARKTACDTDSSNCFVLLLMIPSMAFQRSVGAAGRNSLTHRFILLALGKGMEVALER